MFKLVYEVSAAVFLASIGLVAFGFSGWCIGLGLSFMGLQHAKDFADVGIGLAAIGLGTAFFSMVSFLLARELK